MVKVGFLAFDLDVDAAVGAVVFHITYHIALQTITMYIASEAHVKYATINPYVVGFCHSANFNLGMVLS